MFSFCKTYVQFIFYVHDLDVTFALHACASCIVSSPEEGIAGFLFLPAVTQKEPRFGRYTESGSGYPLDDSENKHMNRQSDHLNSGFSQLSIQPCCHVPFNPSAPCPMTGRPHEEYSPSPHIAFSRSLGYHDPRHKTGRPGDSRRPDTSR